MYRRERFPATRPAILAFFLRLKSHSALGCGRSKNIEVLDQVQDHAKGLGHRQQRLQLRRQVGGQGRGHVPEVKSKQQGSKQFCKFTVIYLSDVVSVYSLEFVVKLSVLSHLVACRTCLVQRGHIYTFQAIPKIQSLHRRKGVRIRSLHIGFGFWILSKLLPSVRPSVRI